MPIVMTYSYHMIFSPQNHGFWIFGAIMAVLWKYGPIEREYH